MAVRPHISASAKVGGAFGASASAKVKCKNQYVKGDEIASAKISSCFEN